MNMSQLREVIDIWPSLDELIWDVALWMKWNKFKVYIWAFNLTGWISIKFLNVNDKLHNSTQNSSFSNEYGPSHAGK